MTSNLPVAGVEQALSGYVARSAIEQGLIRPSVVEPSLAFAGAPAGVAGDIPGSAGGISGGIDSEFARVLVEVMGEGQGIGHRGAVAVDGGVGASGASSFERAGERRVGTDEPAAARLARALAAEAPLPWLAAPLVHRAVDAYRELMNVAV